MAEKNCEKRGERIFNKLNAQEWGDLKWFITGQIQNVLANEHGIGGSKGVSNQVRQRADERITALINSDQFLETLAERLVAKRNHQTNYAKLINDATERAVKSFCEKAAGQAASRVKVHVYIEPDPQQPEETPGFARF